MPIPSIPLRPLLLAGALVLVFALLSRLLRPRGSSTRTGRTRREVAEEQLDVLEGARLVPRPVLERREAEAFGLVEEALRGRPDLRVLAQVNMGEFVGIARGGVPAGGNGGRVHAAFNAKRVDVLVVERAGFRPVLAVEYQGPGHAGRDAAATAKRDAVKRTVLEKAGIDLMEIHAGEKDAAIAARVADWAREAAAAA